MPPKKIIFERKRFAPYLEKLGNDVQIEQLFLDFLKEITTQADFVNIS